MNEIPTIKTIDTAPFKHLVLNLGAVPTAFTEGMTYYEILAWLCQYILTEIIPIVNADSETLNTITAEFTALKAYVDAQVDDIAQLRADFETFTNSVTALITAIETDTQNYVNQELQRFRVDIELLLTQMNNALNTKLDNEIAALNSKIDNMVISNVIVFNASLGEYQTLQQCLDYLFNYQRTEALTAKEYDDLELTAKTYDDKEITAFDYDNFGKTILIGA